MPKIEERPCSMQVGVRAFQPGYLPLREAATWSGVSEKTLKRWIKRGLPFHQAGPREKVLIKPSDIAAFLTRSQQPVPDLDAMVNEVIQDLSTKTAKAG